MNRWNRVHRGIRQGYLVFLYFVAAMMALGTFVPEALPPELERVAGRVVVVVVVCTPVLGGLYLYARRRMDAAPGGRTDAACGFCKRPCGDLALLIAGPEEYICDECVREASATVPPVEEPAGGPTIRCSFCRGERSPSGVWVREPSRICRACIDTCRTVLSGQLAPTS